MTKLIKVKVECPNCDKKLDLQLPYNFITNIVKCPKCGQKYTIKHNLYKPDRDYFD